MNPIFLQSVDCLFRPVHADDYDRLATFSPTEVRIKVKYIDVQILEWLESLLKGGIAGVYKAVGKQHLQHYVDEYAFRYNHRKDERPMFLTVLEQI
jgi:hypothetical protein